MKKILKSIAVVVAFLSVVSSCSIIGPKLGYPKELFNHQSLAPAQVFDNFYMVG